MGEAEAERSERREVREVRGADELTDHGRSLPHCLTASLPHCLTASLPHCLTASLPHCLTASLPQLPHCRPHSPLPPSPLCPPLVHNHPLYVTRCGSTLHTPRSSSSVCSSSYGCQRSGIRCVDGTALSGTPSTSLQSRMLCPEERVAPLLLISSRLCHLYRLSCTTQVEWWRDGGWQLSMCCMSASIVTPPTARPAMRHGQ